MMLHHDLCWLPRLLIRAAWPLGSAVAMLLFVGPARSASTDDFASHRRAALAQLEPKYAQIIAAYPNDAELRDFQQRLEVIDKVASLLLARLRSAGFAAFDQVLSAGIKSPRAASTVKVSMSAAEILQEYEAEFSAALPRPRVSDEQLKVLLAYYNSAIQTAESYIASRGKTMAMVEEKLFADGVELAAVLPFLHVPDDQWTARNTDSLPDWMRTAKGLAAIERFALSVRRPLTGHQLALCQRRAERSAPKLTVAEYARTVAPKLVNGGDYYAALSCLKAGIDSAEAAANAHEAVALSIQRVEILGTTGHPKLAAEETDRLLQKYPESASYGRTAVLRLKYMYEGEEHARIIEEAPRYAANERAAAYRPQILYIQWQSLRRLDRPDDADKIQKAFLTQFPDHPLGADMYFASAVSALAGFNYQEAMRLLDVILYRYPDSKLIPKVKQMQEQLQAVSKTGSGANP